MKTQIVSFHCILKNKLGKEISSSFNSGVLTDSNNQPQLVQNLIKGLQDVKVGERRKIFVPADQAYGLYDATRVLTVSRKSLSPSEHLNVGAQVVRETSDGRPQFFRIIDLSGSQVTLDANHPLAGEDLLFEIEVTEARAATPAELAESATYPSSKNLLH